MYFSTVVTAAFAALPFLVGATPVQHSSRSGLSYIPLSMSPTRRNADGHVDVESVQASTRQVMAKYARAFRVFERNTGQPHPLASRLGHSNERRLDPLATTPLTIANHVWYGNIYIGTPPVTFTVMFDTVLADLFVPGPLCSNCSGHTSFDPDRSSTAKDQNSKATMTFTPPGQIIGEVFTDQVSCGPFKVDNQKLLVASNYNDDTFQSPDFPADGVMGMGFSETSDFKSTPFFQSVINDKLLGDFAPVFAFFMEGGGSRLILGGTDNNLFGGNLTYLNVDTKGFWQVKFDSISVDGKGVSVSTQEAIIDTGVRLVYGTSQDISNIYSNIPGSGQLPNSNHWMIPCDTTVGISMTFGGTTFSFASSSYNLGPVTGSSNCLGGFAIAEENSPNAWLIGNAFLQNVYTEFDVANTRVGFAQVTVQL